MVRERYSGARTRAVQMTVAVVVVMASASVVARDALRVPDLPASVTSRLRQFRRSVDQQRWDDALDQLDQLRSSGSSLVPVNDDEMWKRYLPLREATQAPLAAAAAQHATLLAKYRQRYDGLVEFLDTDVASWHATIREFPLATQSGQAAVDLSERAVRRGNLTVARGWLETSHPRLRIPEHATLASGRAGGSWWWEAGHLTPEVVARALRQSEAETVSDAHVPHPVSPASRWARMALISLWEGDLARANWERGVLQAWRPDAMGTIAGKQVRLLDELREQRANGAQGALAPVEWSTFAADPERTSVQHGAWDGPLKPTWTQPVLVANDQNVAPASRESTAAFSALREAGGWTPDTAEFTCFPVVVGGQYVAWHDHRRIYIRNLRDGTAAWPGSESGIALPGLPPEPEFSLLAAKPTTPCTLHVDGSLVYAMLSTGKRDALSDSYLIGIEVNRQAQLLTGFPRPTPGPDWSYAGSPIAYEGRLVYALWHRDVVPELYVECLDLQTGQPAWRTRLYSTLAYPSSQLPRILLTFHEDRFYVNGNSGAVCAVDAMTGQVAWLTTYPRHAGWSLDQLQQARPHAPELAPCAFHRGRIFVLPVDSDYVFALDSRDGSVGWQHRLPHRRDHASHLLGVHEDRLIVGGARLHWLDVRTGAVPGGTTMVLSSWEPADFSGSGRGFLLDGTVFWPVLSDQGPEIMRLSVNSGRPQQQPFPLWYGNASTGNLCVSHGHLLLAGRDTIYVWQGSLAP